METQNLDIDKIVYELMEEFDKATSLKNKNHLKCSIFYLNEDNNVMYAFNKKDIPQNSKEIMIYTLPQIITPDKNFGSKFYWIDNEHKFSIFKTMVFYSLFN